MKKLLFVLLGFLVVGCTKKQESDPLRYKGCVVVDKAYINGYGIKFKLTNHLRDSISRDYLWIRVPKWEFDRFNIGDTIR